MKSIVLLFLLSVNISCNHLFYYPSRQQFLDPSDFKFSYKSLVIPSESGIKLSAWLFPSQPDGQKIEKNTLIIHLHGNAENISTHFLFTAWLAKHGYDVLIFDYRGYGESTNVAPDQLGLISDTCSVFEWVNENRLLNKKDVFVIGQSLGGAVIFPALEACRQNVKNLRGIVIDSSFGSYRNAARLKLDTIAFTWAFQYPLSWLISDEKSPLSAASKIDVPVLFFHSPKDPVVPYAAGRQLYDAVAHSKLFIDVPVPGHTTALSVHSEQTRKVLIDFLNKKLDVKKKQSITF